VNAWTEGIVRVSLTLPQRDSTDTAVQVVDVPTSTARQGAHTRRQDILIHVDSSNLLYFFDETVQADAEVQDLLQQVLGMYGARAQPAGGPAGSSTADEDKKGKRKLVDDGDVQTRGTGKSKVCPTHRARTGS